jgi:hypothetical protein
MEAYGISPMEVGAGDLAGCERGGILRSLK